MVRIEFAAPINGATVHTLVVQVYARIHDAPSDVTWKAFSSRPSDIKDIAEGSGEVVSCHLDIHNAPNVWQSITVEAISKGRAIKEEKCLIKLGELSAN